MPIAIRSEQLEAFKHKRTQRFDTEMIKWLREHVPTLATTSSAELAQLVRQGRTRARRLGIYEADDVRRFLLYLGHHGPGFGETDETAWAAEILRDGNLTGTEKLEALDARLETRGEPRA